MFKTFIAFLALKSITDSAFEGMEEKDKSELYKEYNESLKSEFEATVSKMVSKEEFDKANNSDEFEKVKALAMKLETELEAVKEKGDQKIVAPKGFEESIEVAIKEAQAEIDKFASGELKKVTIKAPVTIGTNNTINDSGSASHYLTTAFTGIYALIRKRILTYISNVSVGTINNQHATWVEELDEQGAPVFLAEGAAKSQISVRYEEREIKVTKIAAFVKVTKEMLADLPQLITYIQTNLMKRIDIVTENGLFSGDGIGANLSGLTFYATAFTGGGLTTTDPTKADVFRALALQVELAFGSASAVFVKPQILAEMDVEKDSEGRYIMPPFRSPVTGLEVAGIRLIPTTALSGDVDFVGGDLSVVQLRFREGMTIEMDRTGDDFTNNMYTILAEQRLVQFVSANDTQVLIKGDMDSAIAAITAS